MGKNETWTHSGSAESLSSLIPGPSREIVHNNETGEDREIYVGRDQTVGEAIANGQFRDNK